MGTPASGVLTNCTGTATGLTAGKATNLFNTVSATVTDSTGRITYPAQPRFIATLSGSIANVTGDGTQYTLIADTAAVNIGSYYSTSTGIFTAPVTGFYHFDFTFNLAQLVASHTGLLINYHINSTDFQLLLNNPYIQSFDTSQLGATTSFNVQLSATNTLSVNIGVYGGTKTVDLLSSGTYFSGYLIG